MKGIQSMGTGYSDDKDNIGNLPDKPLKSITSPPYGDVEKRDRSIEVSGEKEADYTGYQGNPDNIGALSDKPLKSVMFPPYEDGLSTGSRHGDSGIGKRELAFKRLGTYESSVEG